MNIRAQLRRGFMRSLSVVLAVCAVSAGAGAVYSAEAKGTPSNKMVNIPKTNASSMIIIEAESGVVLAENNADTKRGMASTTKIMTALVALENSSLSSKVTIKREWAGIEGSSIYLREGQSITMEKLLYGLLLESGNDAATAIAGYVGGTVSKFVDLMNEKAAKLGMENTHYVNPHGLDNSNHYSTTRDMAILMRAAMKNETFALIAGSKYYTVTETNQTWKNHNKLLFDYEGCIAGKTGYTTKTGRSLVTAAEKDSMRFIVATLNDPDDWNDHEALYDWAFSKCVRRTITDADIASYSLTVIGGMKDTVGLTLRGTAPSFTIASGDKPVITLEAPHFTYAVVVRGGLAGYISVSFPGSDPVRTPVYFAETILRRGAKQKTEVKKMIFIQSSEQSAQQNPTASSVIREYLPPQYIRID